MRYFRYNRVRTIAVSGRVRDTSTQEAIEINIAVPGPVRYTSVWEAIEVNRLEQLTCTSCE